MHGLLLLTPNSKLILFIYIYLILKIGLKNHTEVRLGQVERSNSTPKFTGLKVGIHRVGSSDIGPGYLKQNLYILIGLDVISLCNVKN